MKSCSSGTGDETERLSLSQYQHHSVDDNIKNENPKPNYEIIEHSRTETTQSPAHTYLPNYSSLSYFYIGSSESIPDESYLPALSTNSQVNGESENQSLHPLLSNSNILGYDSGKESNFNKNSADSSAIEKSTSYTNINEVGINFDPRIHYISSDGDIVELVDEYKLPPLSIAENVYSMNDQKQDSCLISRRRFSHEPRTCPKCGRTFKYPSDLKKHEQVHTEVKKFICGYCKRSFRRLHQLNVHVRIHTGEKPYVCRQCGVSFRHDSSLTMHTRTIHDHMKPFRCDICSKMFGRLSHLRKHQRYVCATARKVSLSSDICEDTNLQVLYTNDNLSTQNPAPTVDKSDTTTQDQINQYNQQYIYNSSSLTNPIYHCHLCDTSFSTIFDYKKHVSFFHNNTFIDSHMLDQPIVSSLGEFGTTLVPPISSGFSINGENTSYNFSSMFEGQNAFLQDDYRQSNSNIGFDVATQYISTCVNNNESKKSAAEIESLMEEKAYSIQPDFEENKES